MQPNVQNRGGGEIRILIADDSRHLRQSISELLRQHSPHWVICGEAENGEDAVREVGRLLPDVVLLDVSIPLLNGVRVAQIVKKDYPSVRVVLMSEQDIAVLKLMADAAGTPHFLAKSRLGVDLIPLLTSLGESAENR